MMKSSLVLLTMFFSSFSHAQVIGSAVDQQVLNCKAAGSVDGISEIFVSETDLKGQIGGWYKIKENGKEVVTYIPVDNGSIFNSEIVLSSVEARYGSSKISISIDTKGTYQLVKTFICDDSKYEEKCYGETELAKEAISCTITN